MSENTNEETQETPEEKPETRLEDLENEDENTEVEDDDQGSEVEDKKTYTKADIEKAAKRRQAALDRARKAEKELAELRKQHATEEQKLQIEAEEKAAAQAAKFKPALVKQHVALEMAFLGLNKTQIDQIVKFVDMENIDVDLDDNSVSGVEEEVVRIQTTFPALFPSKSDEDEGEKKTTAPKKRVPRGDGSPKPPPEKPMSSRDKLIARMQGKKA